MSAYHQMGHDSINLVKEEKLSEYSGAILSPVNYVEDKIKDQIKEHSKKSDFDLVFDPQLYVGKESRSTLKDWSYFPKDIETTDFSSIDWWNQLNDKIITTVDELKPTSVCSPAVLPKVYSSEYYDKMIEVGNSIFFKAKERGVATLQTLLISLDYLSNSKNVMEVASIVTKTKCSRIYLIFVTDIEPRRELKEASLLAAAMKLIKNISDSGLEVTVAFCSTEAILWKIAGAKNCSTGKFFNLRRFTKARFNQPDEDSGGGQLPYFIDESLMGFLRQADILRIEKAGMMDLNKSNNPFSVEIKKTIDGGEKSWLGLSWRQYLWWFADFEKRANISSGVQILVGAEKKWLELEEKNILLDEPRNDGSWIRPWRQAIIEFQKEE